MSVVHFVTHPQVLIDPAVPVLDWPLSPFGVQRMRRALDRSWLSGIAAVFSSPERKAMDAAELIAERLRIPPVCLAGLGENDRSATGYLPGAEFEAVADAFFARPGEAVRGWERAMDAQSRIVAAVGQVLAMASAGGDIVILSHGAVGALLLCHLKGVPIDRRHDQPGTGGGNRYAFGRDDRRLRYGWRRIED